MGQQYLMDTNTVIDFLNGKLPIKAKNWLMEIKPIISVITHIELFSSNRISEQELIQLQTFVKVATIYNHIDENIVQQTITIRKDLNIKTPDAIIAATALVNGMDLISRNSADFKNITGLKVIDPWNL